MQTNLVHTATEVDMGNTHKQVSWEYKFNCLCAWLAKEHRPIIPDVVLTKASQKTVLSWVAHCLIVAVWRERFRKSSYKDVIIPGDFPVEREVMYACSDLAEICKNPNVRAVISGADRIEVQTNRIIVQINHHTPEGSHLYGWRDLGAMDMIMEPLQMFTERFPYNHVHGVQIVLRETGRGDGTLVRPHWDAGGASDLYPCGGFCFGKPRNKLMREWALDLHFSFLIGEALASFCMTNGQETNIYKYYRSVEV